MKKVAQFDSNSLIQDFLKSGGAVRKFPEKYIRKDTRVPDKNRDDEAGQESD